MEHVLARRAKPTDWPSFTEEEITTWTHRIGNHCLVQKTENGAIGNKAWKIKQPILRKSSLKLTHEVGAYASWDKSTITDRQEKLARLAVSTWPR